MGPNHDEAGHETARCATAGPGHGPGGAGRRRRGVGGRDPPRGGGPGAGQFPPGGHPRQAGAHPAGGGRPPGHRDQEDLRLPHRPAARGRGRRPAHPVRPHPGRPRRRTAGPGGHPPRLSGAGDAAGAAGRPAPDGRPDRRGAPRPYAARAGPGPGPAGARGGGPDLRPRPRGSHQPPDPPTAAQGPVQPHQRAGGRIGRAVFQLQRDGGHRRGVGVPRLRRRGDAGGGSGQQPGGPCGRRCLCGLATGRRPAVVRRPAGTGPHGR